MAESSTGLLPPILSDMMLFVSVILSLILLVAISYIWSTRKQDSEELSKLSADVKNLSKKVKDLDSAINMESPSKTTEEIPEAEPFGISINKNSNDQKNTDVSPVNKSIDSVDSKQSTDEKKISPPWTSFLEDYNHIAASMAVPGQLKACESFVLENKLKLLAYSGNMNFVSVTDVKDSRFWAWRIENTNRYAVVPNPMIQYDEELHRREGMKETFASNYSDGIYKKYFVELPATLILEVSKWHISEPGVIKLSRQY